MPVRKRIFLITALLYILYTIFPLFADTFNIPVWLPSLASFGIMFFLFPSAFSSNKTFRWFLIYAILLFLYLIAGKSLTIGIGQLADRKKILVEYAYILPTLGIYSILVYLRDFNLTKQIIKWSMIMLFISFIVAMPLMQSYNNLREAMKIEKNEELQIPGLPSYSLMHAYTLFLPVLCYCIKAFNGKNKVIALVLSAIMCLVIYLTFVTTSLILMIITLLFTLLYSDKNKHKSLLIMSGVTILFLLLYEIGFFVSLIDWIMPAFEGTAVEPKLNDFKESMLVGHLTGGSITGRQDYHSISINSFLHNPIIGSLPVGGHSSLMDRLGGMGLVVGIPFIMIFVTFVKKVHTMYSTKLANTYFLGGIMVGIVYLYNKGNWGCESWLFLMVLLPFGLLTAEQKMMTQSHNINK